MEPFRALVADNLPDTQRTLGFSIQTFLIGLGAVGGSALPDIMARLGVSKVAGPTALPTISNIHSMWALPFSWPPSWSPFFFRKNTARRIMKDIIGKPDAATEKAGW